MHGWHADEDRSTERTAVPFTGSPSLRQQLPWKTVYAPSDPEAPRSSACVPPAGAWLFQSARAMKPSREGGGGVDWTCNRRPCRGSTTAAAPCLAVQSSNRASRRLLKAAGRDTYIERGWATHDRGCSRGPGVATSAGVWAWAWDLQMSVSDGLFDGCESVGLHRWVLREAPWRAGQVKSYGDAVL